MAVVGVACKDGAILAVEKPEETKMMLPGSNRRIFTVAKHVGMAVPGKLPDGRQMVSRAQQEAENYKRFYGTTIPTKVLSDRLANYCHAFSLYWHLRPLGSAALTASYDDQGTSRERERERESTRFNPFALFFPLSNQFLIPFRFPLTFTFA